PPAAAAGPRCAGRALPPPGTRPRCPSAFRVPRSNPPARHRGPQPCHRLRSRPRARTPHPRTSPPRRTPAAARRSRGRPCAGPGLRPVRRAGFPRRRAVNSLVLAFAGLARVVLVHDLGIHHVVALGGRGSGSCLGAVGTVTARGRGARLGIGVHCRAELLGSLGQVLDGLADFGGVFALEGLVGLVDRGLDLVLGLLGDLLVIVLEELLRLVDQRLRLVAGLGLLATLLVLLGVLFGILDHL